MEQKKHGSTGKKPTKMTLIMVAGLMGILLIGIAPMLKTGGGKPKAQEEAVPSAEE